MTLLRIGLVGAGSMGALHARVIAGDDTTELAWIVDSDPVAGESVAERFATTWLPEPDVSSIDAIIVATPTHCHHACVMEAIRAGLPVLVEKPVADSRAHVNEIVDTSTSRGTVLMCGFLERFNPAFRAAQELVREPLHVATIRHSPYTARIRSGVASDLLIHDVDLVAQLMGEAPQSLTAHYGYFEPRSAEFSEDVADATFRFSGGQIASLSASRVAARKVRTLSIAELSRFVEVDLLARSVTIHRWASTADSASCEPRTVVETFPVRGGGEPLQLQLAHFVDLISGRADADAERRSLLLAHHVIDQVDAAASRRSSTIELSDASSSPLPRGET